MSYGYSPSGNLTSKSDFGTSYSYALANSRSSGCGPHAAYAAGGMNYACDANGNVYGGNTLAIAYDADNHPRTARRGGAGSVIWAYDVNGGMDYESSSRGVRYFAPGGYEQVGSQGIHELGPIIVTRTNGANTVTTALRGRLGSTLDTIDAGLPSSANTRDYDAFGATRDGNMSTRPNGTLNLNDTIHGFTQHEHADDVWLIHMGGRIYDYNLGRFLSVDPIVQNPLSSQGLNPYSYIGNNPLSGTDPTGYSASNSQHCDAPGSGDAGCMSTANKIDGFQTVYSASSYMSSSGVTGQSANSVMRVDAANAGNPNADPASRIDGNLSSAGNNGGSCQVPVRCDGGAAATQDDRNTPTLSTVKITEKAGAWATPEQVSALEAALYGHIQGSDSSKETKFFMDDSGHVLRKTQIGCNGADRCIFDGDEAPKGTTLYGHTHVYSNGSIGAMMTAGQRAAQFSRDMPGPGDAGPLAAHMVSAIMTRGGEKYLIEGTRSTPQIRYLGGGNSNLGTFTAQHWQPGANILHLANDYITSQEQK